MQPPQLPPKPLTPLVTAWVWPQHALYGRQGYTLAQGARGYILRASYVPQAKGPAGASINSQALWVNISAPQELWPHVQATLSAVTLPLKPTLNMKSAQTLHALEIGTGNTCIAWNSERPARGYEALAQVHAMLSEVGSAAMEDLKTAQAAPINLTPAPGAVLETADA